MKKILGTLPTIGLLEKILTVAASTAFLGGPIPGCAALSLLATARFMLERKKDAADADGQDLIRKFHADPIKACYKMLGDNPEAISKFMKEGGLSSATPIVLLFKELQKNGGKIDELRDEVTKATQALARLKKQDLNLPQGSEEELQNILAPCHEELADLIQKNREDIPNDIRKDFETFARDIKADLKDLKKGLEDIKGILTDPGLLKDRFEKEIRDIARQRIGQAKAGKAGWKEIYEIEKQRDQQIGTLNTLIEVIRQGFSQDADPVYKDAVHILQTEGIRATLSYLERQRARIFEKSNAMEGSLEMLLSAYHRTIQPLLLEAQLLETSLKYEESLSILHVAARKNPKLWKQCWQARNQLGRLYWELARWKDAEGELRAANSLATGTEDEATALNNLALLLKETNRHKEAEPLYRRALKISEASYGKEHPTVATSLNNLALLLKETNRHKEAEPLFRRALEIDEASYGKEHPEVATSLNSLAALLWETNRHKEAEPLFRRALKICEASYGKEHPKVATAFNNLALLLENTNRHKEAEPLFRRALEIREASYGKEHPTVATSLSNLALLLKETNRHKEAEPLFRRALKICEASYGKEHPEVATSLNSLAALLWETNRHKEAEPLYRRALEIDEASYGKEHPTVATALNNLALLLENTNRHKEAEPLFRRALEIDEASYGKEHPHLMTAFNNYMTLLIKMEMQEEKIAEKCFTLGAEAGIPDEEWKTLLARLLGKASTQ